MYTFKDLRKKKLIDNYHLCGIIGVGRSHLHNIEKGKAVIYTNELRQIAEFCGIKQSEIDTTEMQVVPYGN